MRTQDIINFWFQELSDKQRFVNDENLDSLMRERFGQIHKAAMAGELFTWRMTAEGRLAEIVVLDQFSRNMFRGKPESFYQDAQALTLAQELVANGHDHNLSVEHRVFAYMPFMHSESDLIHEQAERLYSQPGMEGALAFEKRHKVIIERFGRFPHRNTILGRTSTPQELAFLETPGSSF
ncbi:MAG: DUF924 domain-containing protein [Rhodoferax sp.]|uniref:DUF924 family protein n=1 Tax=Rhodoferax sp. TaxID=50421 RepID=UPI002621332C|nr:DUF924 family protein [Rhodoferax sp.]MDD2882190.1 DUF924 domain-containing protein [Rhodoferax sp.]